MDILARVLLEYGKSIVLCEYLASFAMRSFRQYLLNELPAFNIYLFHLLAALGERLAAL